MHKKSYFLVGESPLGVSSAVSISSELESLPESESLSDSEPDELDASSVSSFAFDAPFKVCFCLLSGSGEVDALELLSLPEEDGGAMVVICRRRHSTEALGFEVAFCCVARIAGRFRSFEYMAIPRSDVISTSRTQTIAQNQRPQSPCVEGKVAELRIFFFCSAGARTTRQLFFAYHRIIDSART